MGKGSLGIIRDSLQSYADRGIFRGFSEAKSGSFKFVWLAPHPLELSADTRKGELRFKRMLPAIPAGSEMYSEIRKFVRERHESDLPEHRRIDPKKAEAGCSNRGGFVSISIKVKNNQYAYGVNRLVNLAHELFLRLRDRYPDYLMENFDAPQE